MLLNFSEPNCFVRLYGGSANSTSMVRPDIDRRTSTESPQTNLPASGLGRSGGKTIDVRKRALSSPLISIVRLRGARAASLLCPMADEKKLYHRATLKRGFRLSFRVSVCSVIQYDQPRKRTHVENLRPWVSCPAFFYSVPYPFFGVFRGYLTGRNHRIHGNHGEDTE